MVSNKKQFISIVDDEPDIVYLFRDALSIFNYIHVLTFTDSPMAYEHFRFNSKNYKCVISDFRMPSMNGIELLKAVKTIRPSVKTLLTSAFDVKGELFKECNCVDKFLQKPIKISDLINSVQIQMVKPSQIKIKEVL